MPPVFGPWSLSQAALWSWEEGSGSTVLPSVKAMNEASSPVRNSSITTRLPAAPKALSRMIRSTACSASATVWAMITPLPAASPSALTTQGMAMVPRYFFASERLAKDR